MKACFFCICLKVISFLILIFCFNESIFALFFGCFRMKKNNNKFRSNNNNIYNLNYRFDSVSPAGKFSGTALDLIRRYNDLAKEAQTAGNYVEMEVFRQYAEHYRKIVTEANERRASYQQQNQAQTDIAENEPSADEPSSDAQTPESIESTSQEVIVQKPLSLKKKTLKIVEVKENDGIIAPAEPQKKTRAPRKKAKAESEGAAAV